MLSKESFNRLKLAVPTVLTLAILGLPGCTGESKIPESQVTPTPVEQVSPSFINVSKIESGETFRKTVERLFGELYKKQGVDFEGYGWLENYSSLLTDPRITQEGKICLVFPDKLTAERATDLLYGDGENDSDNVIGPLWEGQEIGIGRTTDIDNLITEMKCNTFWLFNSTQEYIEGPVSKRIIRLGANLIKKEGDEEKSLIEAQFRYVVELTTNEEAGQYLHPISKNGWEVRVGENWLPVSKLRNFIEKGYSLEDAIRELEKR